MSNAPQIVRWKADAKIESFESPNDDAIKLTIVATCIDRERPQATMEWVLEEPLLDSFRVLVARRIKESLSTLCILLLIHPEPGEMVSLTITHPSGKFEVLAMMFYAWLSNEFPHAKVLREATDG